MERTAFDAAAPPRSRRDENTERTRRAVLDAARALFSTKGFSATSTEEIVRDARVTRGALYHHFSDKRDLFKAVLEEMEEELALGVAKRALTGSDVWACVVEGTTAFLDACLDPAVQRIVLLDGASVLGWETWRVISERYALGIIRAVLDEAVKQGVVDQQPVEPLAHMVHGALHEAAMQIALADDRGTARAEVGNAVLNLLDGLRRPVDGAVGSRG